MSDDTYGNTTSSETMTSGGRYNAKRRAKKRQRDSQATSSSESGSTASGNPKDGTEMKSSSRPQTPTEGGLPVDEAQKECIEGESGGPGPSNQSKPENDPGNIRPSSPRALAMNEPFHSKAGGKQPRGKGRGRRAHRSDISECQSEGDKKRVRRAGKGDIDPEEKCPKGGKRRGPSKSQDTRSCDSRSTYSGRSSGRSSARSQESLDGHTELLESLVHAAHAEDKLHREKKELQKELTKLEKQKDKLAQELIYALKEVDKLKSKAKCLFKEKEDMRKRMQAEKAVYERELQALGLTAKKN